MKKAMKLVWAVLFALPVFSLVSCESDDNDGLFKDYSYLVGKSLDDVIKDMGSDYLVGENGNGALYYELNSVPNVTNVDVFFTFFDYNELGLITYDKAVEVDVTLKGLEYSQVYNELNKEYGNGEMISYEDEEGNVEDTEIKYTKGNRYIYLYTSGSGYVNVDYVDKKAFDEAKKNAASAPTRGADFDLRAAVKAAKKANSPK